MKISSATDILLNVFLAIAVDTLESVQFKNEMDQEHEDERQAARAQWKTETAGGQIGADDSQPDTSEPPTGSVTNAKQKQIKKAPLTAQVYASFLTSRGHPLLPSLIFLRVYILSCVRRQNY